jgi:hypothetical protein
MEEQIGKLTTINMGVKAVVLRNGYDVKDFWNFITFILQTVQS